MTRTCRAIGEAKDFFSILDRYFPDGYIHGMFRATSDKKAVFEIFYPTWNGLMDFSLFAKFSPQDQSIEEVQYRWVDPVLGEKTLSFESLDEIRGRFEEITGIIWTEGD